MPAALFSEKKLAEILGLDREDLREARKKALKKGPDFVDPGPGREIALTLNGISKLREYWRAAGIPVTWDQVDELLNGHKAAAEPVALALERLVVTRVYPNRHLLEARFDVTPQDHRRVTVWVKTNENFVPNMGIAARPRAAGSSSFDFVGRCPRRRGKF